MVFEKKKVERHETADVTESVPCLCSKRWIMGYMGLLLGVVLYLLRVDFSMAMVCMVMTPETSALNKTNTTSWFYSHNTNFSGNFTAKESTDVGDDCRRKQVDSVTDNLNAEFVWSKSFQSLLLSVYYIGCFVSQVPGGWIANRYGGKRVVLITMLVSSICTLLTPVLIRTNPYLIFPLRILMGICSGGVLPAWYDLVGIWVPPFERSRFTAFCWIGQVLGTILAYSTSGILCAHAPDNGWPSVFYVHGSVAVLFVISWQILVADRPTKHRRISEAELSFIARFVYTKTKEESRDIPWKSILTSRHVWAIYICHWCDAWTFFTLLTCLPMFLKDVLKINVEKNGLYSSIPYVAFAISLFVFGNAADFLIAKRILSVTATRRIFQVIAFLGAGVSIVLSGYVTCNQDGLVILYICLCNVFLGVGEGGGYSPNPVDIAPKYASIIFAVSNTIAQIPGFIAPAVIGSLTPKGTSEEWRTVFYIFAGLNVLGALVFGTLSSGEAQPWSKNENIEVIIKVKANDTNKDMPIEEQNKTLENGIFEDDLNKQTLIEQSSLLMKEEK